MPLSPAQAEIIARLGRLSPRARRAVEAVQEGRHRSARRGLSLEPAGHRPYQSGDDPRRLDWTVWARTDRLMVRLHEEESRMRACLALDCSGSMAYGRRFACARDLAAALAVLLDNGRDRVSLALLGDDLRALHAPSAGGCLPLLEVLEGCSPGGGTGLGKALEALAERLPRRGLVLVLSDCLEHPADLARGLAHLRHRRQEVAVLRLVDAREANFPFIGPVSFLGCEGEGVVGGEADALRGPYLEAAAAHAVAVAAACHSAGATCETHRLDRDPAVFLVRALSRLGRSVRP